MARMTFVSGLLLLLATAAAAPASAWVLSVPGDTVLAATDEYIFVTRTQSAPIYTLTAYNTSTQTVLWTSQPCFLNYQVASNFQEIQPGVQRYLCGSYTNQVVSSHTLDVHTGTVLSNTSLQGEVTWGGRQTAIANTQTGLYCMPVWPPKCVFANGTLLSFPEAQGFATNPHLYFSGTTLVVVTSEQVFFIDAVTGAYLSAITQFERDTSFSYAVAATVEFVEDMAILTYTPQYQVHGYAVVVNITERAVSAQMKLGNVTFSNGGFQTHPAVVRRGAGLLVLLPVYQSPTFSMMAWEIPTANGAATASTEGSVPTADLIANVTLVTKSVSYERGMQCVPAGGFVACSLWAGVSGTVFNVQQSAATTLVDLKSMAVVSNLTKPAVFSADASGVAGDMIVVAGALSGAVDTTQGQDTPYAGVAAFNATTGAVLWEGSYLFIGPRIAYDAVNACVVFLGYQGIVCIDTSGKFGATSSF